MGKIVKYCAACEESFAEKFAFCPNCAQPLTAFEMNPVSSGGDTVLGKQAGQTVLGNNKPPESDEILEVPTAAPIVAETIAVKPIESEPFMAEPIVAEAAPEVETPMAGETKVTAASNQTQAFTLADIEELENLKEEPAEEPAADDFTPETKTFAAAAGIDINDYRTNDLRSNLNAAEKSDDGYHITVIEEKNGKQRAGLLLGTLVLMVLVALSAVVISIFNKDLGVGAIDSNDPVYLVDESTPVDLEEQPKPKNDKKAGGGGGSGDEELEKASKGRLVSQSENPITPPNARVPQLTNPELKVIQETKGNIKRPITEERAGLPGSDNLNPSNGTGRGGGIGSGVGLGQGSGNGDGEGNGNGSGSGNGNGDGNGNGRGSGNSGIPKPPPPPPVVAAGPSEALKILSKPSPKYTDAARQNQVTGAVTLKITFSASGQIGSVVTVSGLPYGLTEQAIAAAKQIRFEPAKKGGVPVSVSKTVTFNFTIY